ncbi:ABC transporter permease [Petroclostridium sp. X23]|uniref:ABC transporter permease n=1 Tax=Petroclostridium sp. X23 TaxID=3045146 RepID=UPI0024ACF38A|nr:ABC transporter permease [Petroclostridium sp. X23]WHH60239.1 ABC transporter permease [Petroclostridium sp. X23]
MVAILKRELKAYFFSPIGYIFIGFFLLLSGFFFAATNLFTMTADMKQMFGNLSIVFLFLVPVLTMRLISEEKKTKTDQLLFTSPVSVTGIVLGKYLAAVSVFFVTLLITGAYPVILYFFSKPALGEILAGYLGFFLMGTSFIAVGLFISALTENQITAAVASFGTLLLLWLMDWVVPFIQNPYAVKALEWLSILRRFQDFVIGVLSLSPIIYYISFSAAFVFLTIRVLEKRRWS